MISERIAVTNPVGILPGLGQANVAASLTDVQLLLPDGSTDGFVMPQAGYVIGIAGSLSVAAGAGQLNVGVTIDGTEQPKTTQIITTATAFRAKFSVNDNIRFAAGQKLGAEITTNGAWNGLTAELATQLYVVFEDWDYA